METEKPPISAEQIIEKSKQWTLDGDCILLQWMDQISKNLEDRVTNTSLALNDMSTNLDRTTVALCNVTNNLAALQYSQFVENRVLEDDETLTNVPQAPSVDVTEYQEPSKNIYSFLKKNIEMMNSCHEAFSISYDDSDDDEPATNVVYRSKNPYEARPVPHIYGSELWKDKWHIGLCDSDNDFSGDENSEQFSESSSTDESFESNAPTMSEWDSTAWGLNANQAVDGKEIHMPSNDEESTHQGEEYSQSKVSTLRANTITPNVQQPIEDQRYYQHIPRSYQQPESLFDNDSKPPEITSAVIPIPKKVIQESYIPNEPPPDEQPNESENNRRIGAKKTLNLFDDDEFSSFMDQIVQKATNKSVDTPIKTQQTPTKAKEPYLVDQEPPIKAAVPNLFNDSDEYVVASAGKKQEQPKKVPSSNIFNESEDLFSRISTQEPQKKVVPNLFDDAEDLFKEKLNKPAAVEQTVSPARAKIDIFTAPSQPVTIGKTKLKNLFDDDDDDDDFDSLFASKPKTSNTFTQKTSNLFDDDISSGSAGKDLFIEKEEIKDVSSKQLPPVSRSIFDDEVDRNVTLERDPISKANEVKHASVKEVSLLKENLFANDADFEDEDDIFASRSAKQGLSDDSLSKEISLFGEEKDNKLESIPTAPLLSSNITKIFSNETSSEPYSLGAMNPQTHFTDIFADDFNDEINEINPIDKPTQNIKQKDPILEVKPSLTPKISNVVEKTSVLESGERETQKVPESSKPAIAPKLPVIARKPQVLPVRKPQQDEGKPMETPQHSKSTVTRNQPEIARKPLLLPSAKTVTEKIVPEVHSAGSSIKSAQPSSNSQSDVVSVANTSSPDFNSSNNPTKVVQTSATPQQKGPLSDIQDLRSGAAVQVIEGTETLKTPNLSNEELPSKTDSTEVERNREQPNHSLDAPKPKEVVSKDQQITIPSYTTLFQDDLPPEDENPNVASYENSPMHTADEDVSAVHSVPNVSYNSINLFTDVPPDDDDFSVSSPSSQTKRIHSIFYDDFHETIEAGREMRSPSSYIINDEPPPDECDSKPVVTTTTSEKPKISKLKKMDFQINVGALLPSAKMPSFKKPAELVKTLPSDDKPLISKKPSEMFGKPSLVAEDVPSEGQQIKPRDLPENILPNLNRNRAKVQIKRRPSTRKGRQESYRKSMIEENSSIADQNSSDDENQFKKPIVKQALFEDLGTFSLRKTSEENTTDGVGPMPEREVLFEESDKFIKQSNPSGEIFKQFTSSSVKQNTNKIPSLFDDTDSDPENIFETMKTKAEIPRKVDFAPMQVKNLDSLFESDGVDENPFGTPKAIVSQTVAREETLEVAEEKTSKSVADQPKQLSAVSSKSIPSATNESVKSLSLFGESDDGSDDLFKNPKTSKKPVPQRTFEKKEKSRVVPKAVKPTSSLFSSDEGSGSGDDIFGKPKMKVTSKKINTTKDKPLSASLFADLSDDDDDDLFRTTKKKPAGVDKSVTKQPSSKKQPTKLPTKPESGNSINPLSDLLGS